MKSKKNNPYKHIKTKKNHSLLVKSGMFWEFHPELSGDWEKDKIAMGVGDKKQIPADHMSVV